MSKKYLKTLPPGFTSIVKNKSNTNTAICPYFYAHSKDEIDTNLLITLHGMGDQASPIHHNFAMKMDLPQTAVLSLDASLVVKKRRFVELPLEMGYTWFVEHDLSMEGLMRASSIAESTGNPFQFSYLDVSDSRRIESLRNAIDCMMIIIKSLTDGDASSWPLKNVFVFGYSCGAALAAEVALERVRCGLDPLGGVICVAGGARSRSLSPSLGKLTSMLTPILIIVGSNDGLYTVSDAKKFLTVYKDVSEDREKNIKANVDNLPIQLYIKQGKGHDMIRSREEMEQLMKFFAERLVKRMIGMEEQGWIEASNASSVIKR